MNTQTYNTPYSSIRPGLQFTGWLQRQGYVLLSWIQRSQTRAALSRLDQHLLDDIGVSAEEASIEAGKPFWKQ